MTHAYNNLTLNAPGYVNTSLETAEDIAFSTYYPGGFGEAAFFLPGDAVRDWPVPLASRVVIRNGLQVVYEGYVTNASPVLDAGRRGLAVKLLGFTGYTLMTRNWRKPWADARIDDTRWEWQTGSGGAEKCTIERNNRIRFTPKGVAWLNTQAADVRYTAPAGETIKRITASFDLQEGAQAWKLKVASGAPFAEEWTRTTTGTGTLDVTLPTPRAYIQLGFEAQANQTPASDGTIYGEFSNIVVYTETSAINLTEIAKDIDIKLGMSSDASLIGANSLSLVPFVSDGDERMSDILSRACGFGDASNNPWAWAVWESERASDNKPIMQIEAQPSLTSADYLVRLDETNIVPPVELERSLETVRNYITVRYTTADGRQVVVTPTDDANLTDSASIALYGQRDEMLDIDTTSLNVAKSYGIRYLREHRWALYQLSSGLTVAGYIRGAAGQRVPASEIRAGKRVKIENFLSNVSGTGLTFLINQTDYDGSAQTCSISVGQASRLDAWLARWTKR